MKQFVFVCALVFVTSSAFAQREFYSDGSYTDFVETPGFRRWTHHHPISATQYRVQYDIEEGYYPLNGSSFRGEITRSDDFNLDGSYDRTEKTHYNAYNQAVISRLDSPDGNGVWFNQYSDTSARYWSTPYEQGRADQDTRNVIRVYSNAFCYVQPDGNCWMETNCDVQIQSFNQMRVFGLLQQARLNRDNDLLTVRVLEMRYDRELKILAACKASKRRG